MNNSFFLHSSALLSLITLGFFDQLKSVNHMPVGLENCCDVGVIGGRIYYTMMMMMIMMNRVVGGQGDCRFGFQVLRLPGLRSSRVLLLSRGAGYELGRRGARHPSSRAHRHLVVASAAAAAHLVGSVLVVNHALRRGGRLHRRRNYLVDDRRVRVVQRRGRGQRRRRRRRRRRRARRRWVRLHYAIVFGGGRGRVRREGGPTRAVVVRVVRVAQHLSGTEQEIINSFAFQLNLIMCGYVVSG